MSHTVIIDEYYRSRQAENRLNAVIRHCKIGKVTHKYHAVRSPPADMKTRGIIWLTIVIAAFALAFWLSGCATRYQPPGEDLWRAL